jgi:hypothetical protein
MTPNSVFQDFLRDIEPSATTKANASSAHTALRDFLSKHEEFRQVLEKTFLSGSYNGYGLYSRCPANLAHFAERVRLRRVLALVHGSWSSAGSWRIAPSGSPEREVLPIQANAAQVQDRLQNQQLAHV